MDTTSVQRDGSYDWDTSVINDRLVAMKAGEMAFTACSDFCVGPQTLCHSVAVTERLSPSAPGYHVIVHSRRALKSLEYTLEDSGGKLVRRERIVRNVPAPRRVDLPIPLAGEGVYTLKIDAVGSVGSQALLSVRIVQQ